MATQREDGSGSQGIGYDAALNARPAAPDAIKGTFGRSSRDLAADEPAGFGPEPHAGADESDTFAGATAKVDPDAGGDAPLHTRSRKFDPTVDPDTRVNLRPTTGGDAAPVHPAYDESDAGTRAATGAVAGLIAAAIALALAYALYGAGLIAAPTFLVAAEHWTGLRGAGGHVLGALRALAAGALWGALFGLFVRRPTFARGLLFGLLSALLLWVVIAPSLGRPLFLGWTAEGIGLPLLFNVFIWGGIAGTLAGRWLRPPYSADLTPRAAERT